MAGGVEARELKAAVAVGGAQHGDLDALAAYSGGAVGPIAFNGHAAFEGKAEFGEELDGGIDVFYHDPDVVHTLGSHDVSLMSNGAFQRSRFFAIRCKSLVRRLKFRIIL